MSYITQKWVNLLLPFTSDYNAKLTSSELAKLTKIPQQTCSRLLNKLEKKNLLRFVKKGRNKLFFLDLNKETTKMILSLLEIQKALQFQFNFPKISLIINEMLANCNSIILFGSYAANTSNKESDLDLLVINRANKKEISKIKRKQTFEINEHFIQLSEFKKSLGSQKALALEILRNHIIFGNFSDIIDVFMEYEKR
jgi:predicted nucleotidyltransferase